LTSAADWIAFFPDAIGKELVNVSDERLLDCWGTDALKWAHFQERTCCWYCLLQACLPSGSVHGLKYQQSAEWYFFLLLFSINTIYFMVVTEKKHIGNNNSNKHSCKAEPRNLR